MGNRFTPETGYPSVPEGEKLAEDDVLVFADGSSITGAEFNKVVDDYYNSERGQAYLQGEAEPLAIVDPGNDAVQETNVYLDGRIDVTEIDPLLKLAAEEIARE